MQPHRLVGKHRPVFTVHPFAVGVVFALMGMAAQAADTTTAKIDSLLTWAETAYPQTLPPGAKTVQASGYTYRCYSNDTLCIGVKDGQVYVYQAGVGISALGALDNWTKTADQEKIQSARIFPGGLAVSAPTRQGTTSSFAALPPPGAGPTAMSSMPYSAATKQIDELLSGVKAPLTGFDANVFLALTNNAACFGPSLSYTGHPDGGSGTLPSGDLGIWLETDTASGDACAAAQLNARMDGASSRANTALMTVASLLRAAIGSGTSLPSPGASVSVVAPMNALGVASTTFTKALIELDSGGSVWTYSLEFTFTDASGASHAAAINLSHTPSGTPTSYQGIMTLSVTGTFNGGTCGSGSNPVTRIDTFKYHRTGPTSMSGIQRSGQFCGTGSYTTLGSYESDGQLKPSSSWSDDFSRFGASYDPTSLRGYYLYGWQAGSGDRYSRLLQLGINGIGSGATNDGESYFGYGDPIASTDGKIKGFYCMWAGPKPVSPVGLQTRYAQRQFIRYDLTTNKWSQPAGGGNIRYAPTDSCAYTGSGFWYDRNLSGSNDETTADLTVTAPDLMGLSGAATIDAAIAARGYVIPGF